MNDKRYFFLIYPEDSYLKLILDSIRIIVDPSQNNFSHITIKGPYSKRVDKILKKDNQNIAGKRVRISGSGCFFGEKQNTVYLSCVKTTELENIWKTKKDKSYREFNPHLTIYDGNDRQFAEKLLSILDKYSLNLEFTIKALTMYESKSSKNSLFNLQSQIDFNKLNELVNCDLNENQLFELDNQKRLEIVEKLCSSLSQLSLAESPN